MFKLVWADEATEQFNDLQARASAARSRKTKQRRKSSRDEGLFKQVNKAITLLANDRRHPGLNTHEFTSLQNPYDDKAKVFEAYAQNNTPGAYRVFWCYGPGKGELTILAITPHP
jgi:hypothetical protein